MANQRKKGRACRGVVMNESTWQIINDIAIEYNSNVSNMIEKIVLWSVDKGYLPPKENKQPANVEQNSLKKI